ncbi:transcriptional regulator family: Fungal Specific TF [Trichoderma harzianum]|nr:transcriptional regulator family: Fungal Specific TF [Trichoderma harzianum]
MVSGTRSANGCWTCRLRRKKCDEAKPMCEICTSLALTCHGYGSRPIWMDGQSKEREMSALIRDMVKTAANQKRRVAMQRRHQNPQITRRIPTSISTGTGVTSDSQPSPPLPKLSSTARVLSSPPQTSASEEGMPHTVDVSPPILNTDAITPSLAIPAADNQADLLMHYLDHVFPLQFPFYHPSAVTGGRGWLLPTLTRTEPLYHTALSLAAYHRQYLFCPSVRDLQRGCFHTEALQQQRVIAIGELRQHLEGMSSQPTKRSLVDNINLLCCMVLLISLEVSSIS